MKPISIILHKPLIALAIAGLTLTQQAYALRRIAKIGIFDIYDNGSIDTIVKNPITGEEELHTLPKTTPHNLPALQAALKEVVEEKLAIKRDEEEAAREEAALEVRKQAFMTKAKAVNKVTVDPKTGAWHFEYLHSEHDFEEGDGYTDITFRKRSMFPPNMFDVTIKSTIKAKGNDVFEYAYLLSNGKNSKQQIISFAFGNKIDLTSSPPPKGDRSDWNKIQNKLCDARVVPSKVVEVDTYCNEIGSGYGLYAHMTKTWVEPNGEYRSTYAGLKPGQSWDQMRVTVPVLPGVFMAPVMGDNDGQKAPEAILNVDSPAKNKLEHLLNTIGKEVPIIAPQIAIPKPYNGAELAKRIKADIQTWIVKKPGYELQTGNELITPTALLNLNRQFDLLIPALERKDKAAVRDIAKEMLTQLFTPHPDLAYYKFFTDDEIHNTKPKRTLTIAADATVKNTATMEPLYRVAARALGFNLMYLINRSEKGE